MKPTRSLTKRVSKESIKDESLPTNGKNGRKLYYIIFNINIKKIYFRIPSCKAAKWFQFADKWVIGVVAYDEKEQQHQKGAEHTEKFEKNANKIAG